MIARFPVLFLYFLLSIFATMLTSAASDPYNLSSLRSGSLEKLRIHHEPFLHDDLPIVDKLGNSKKLSDFHDQVLVMNFFAVWCAPCRVEMPTLDRLQSLFDRDKIRVITISIGKHADGAVEKFMNEIGIQHVEYFFDDNMKLSRQMGVLGLPTTILFDKKGREVARLLGEADWDSESSISIITRLSQSDF